MNASAQAPADRVTVCGVHALLMRSVELLACCAQSGWDPKEGASRMKKFGVVYEQVGSIYKPAMCSMHVCREFG